MTAEVGRWAGGKVPEWTLGDRLRKARLEAGLDQRELASELGIGRNSVMTYEGGRTVPRRPVLLAWAMRCGVPYEWLHSGSSPQPDEGAQHHTAPYLRVVGGVGEHTHSYVAPFSRLRRTA